MTVAEADDEVEALYRSLLDRWNDGDAAGYGAMFTDDGSIVGFDGSSVETPAAITGHLASIFADHRTATYVAKVREVRPLGERVALLRAVAGLVPPGGSDVNPDANAIQALVAVRGDDGWRVAHFQNTPAAFHGRPEEADALTAELRTVVANRSDRP
ncbi:MAG: hypothetical protein QOJ69_2051 [Actinomycetota bacterium]|jgi:uncharacterized protein (TIGR02246 family)|nr:hypothetical protein [Actinomycetota bacterium]